MPEPADHPSSDPAEPITPGATNPADVPGGEDPTGSDPTTAEPIAVRADARPAATKKLALVLILAAVILAADQITKVIVVANLIENGPSPKILGGLVYFSLIRNPGAAFSIGTGMTWILAIVAVAVVVVIIRMASKLRSAMWATSLGLILGGALGNLTDRIFRSPGVMRGHVVDFVSVFAPDAKYFPVFNVADSAITIGGVLLVLTALLGIEFDGTRPRRDHRAPSEADQLHG
jgi:signal peptidase II